MRHLIASWRLLRGLLHVAGGVWLVQRRFGRMTQTEREAAVQRWAARLLQLWDIGLVVHGQPASAPVLLASNHVSWLDIVVLHATRYCRFVSKADVRHWPVVGALATGAGTLYIERSRRRDAMRVAHEMAAALQRGEVVAVFPEGTTGDGRTLLPFHANLLQAAIACDAPIQPVALQFVQRGSRQTSFAPSYVGDESLLDSIWNTLSAPAPGIEAIVTLAAPQQANGRDRREWAQALHDQIDQMRQAR